MAEPTTRKKKHWWRGVASKEQWKCRQRGRCTGGSNEVGEHADERI